MVETTIFKGYRNGKEVWAIHKTYGEGDTATDFICIVEPNEEIRKIYESEKDVFNNTIKKARK